MDEISNKQIWVGILLVVILIGGYVGANNFLGTPSKTPGEVQQIQEDIESIQKQLDPYSYKNSLKRATILTNFVNSTSQNKPTDSFNIDLVTRGNFSKAYLYIVASVDGAALSEPSDIYLKLTGSNNGLYVESGGHLIESKGLTTPKFDDHTELLFDLSDVKYKTDYLKQDIESVSGDWLSVINEGGARLMLGFSSTPGTGTIHEISIFYECAAGSECKITE